MYEEGMNAVGSIGFRMDLITWFIIVGLGILIACLTDKNTESGDNSETTNQDDQGEADDTK